MNNKNIMLKSGNRVLMPHPPLLLFWIKLH